MNVVRNDKSLYWRIYKSLNLYDSTKGIIFYVVSLKSEYFGAFVGNKTEVWTGVWIYYENRCKLRILTHQKEFYERFMYKWWKSRRLIACCCYWIWKIDIIMMSSSNYYYKYTKNYFIMGHYVPVASIILAYTYISSIPSTIL